MGLTRTVQRTMGLKGQYNEQWVQETVQRSVGLKENTNNNGFEGQYKEEWL